MTTSAPPRKPPRSLRQQDAFFAWLFLTPSLLVILGITLQPILTTLFLSFYNAPSGINATREFVGFANYGEMLTDATFWATIGRTLYFTFMSVALELLLGLVIAQLINSRPPGWKFLRLSLIIPWAFPTIVNGSMWRWIYNADFGALNALLMQLGIIDHYVAWLVNPFWAMNLVILADLWHVVPFVALILQAAMAGISVEVDEAAMMDGANAWQRFLYIRMPLLRPAILVALIVRTVEAFRVFDIVYIITGGGPAFGTVTISYLTYLQTFSYGNLGIGAALSFLISFVTVILAFIYIRFLYSAPQESQS
jgi:ABC-type sugar transport system permease subunit